MIYYIKQINDEEKMIVNEINLERNKKQMNISCENSFKVYKIKIYVKIL